MARRGRYAPSTGTVVGLGALVFTAYIAIWLGLLALGTFVVVEIVKATT